MSAIEVLNVLNKLLKKYQVPFGIAIWGFTESGTAKEIRVDEQGRLYVVGDFTAEIDFSELMGPENRSLTDIYEPLSSYLPHIDIPLSTVSRSRVYEQTFETGESDLTAVNCIQTVQSTEVYAGTYALQVTIPAGQTGYVETPTRPISPNQRIIFSFAHKEDINITNVKLDVVWYRPNLKELKVDEYTLTPSTSWQVDFRDVAAPKGAAYMALRMQATASTTSDGNVYLDDMFMDIAGQIFRFDGAGNLMSSVQNFPDWFSGSTKTTDDLFTKLSLLSNVTSRFAIFTSRTLAAGEEFTVVQETGRGLLREFLIRSPDTSFKVTITVDGLTAFEKTYDEIRAIEQNSPDISAFAELDENGDPTGYYIVSIRNIPFYTGLTVKVQNTGTTSLTFNQLFAKYFISIT
ncbi:MAG: hypothetical protein DRH17_12530 [Deltaproteobacteria bacterium]|nr:MAG: hypothetical protein DRH17_12530 [Deltaproteobacteria bacterium]